jgi:hypothetical protein
MHQRPLNLEESHPGSQTPKMHIEVLELGTCYVTSPNGPRLDPFADVGVAVHAGTNDARPDPQLGKVCHLGS